MRRKPYAPSVSSVLEDIPKRLRRGEEKQVIEKAVVDYYDSCPADETEASWGDFAMGEFPGAIV